ncbi:hypothetical protein MYCOZU1_01149 [Mycobacterium intracellulare subsp. chimaera]|uniref:Uncharacterized protein n=1 Tax=Mycobacterium intracellulare subsp. chimaera TaxID=222805 RepID=A0A220XQ17_MYCIT|nr:hypothetical protein MYCODSM44623_01054 [Mycobacterium intracellulare subsp. chimaera]ASL13466.1 hypothetical protein MYCOZU2_01024 [Mycobacterium intracellulare subsp. chimaera]ASL19600.1 hypothetical protein MYCOZU1_01149 [Mycobacterium intracellulare subsp. chimaera]
MCLGLDLLHAPDLFTVHDEVAKLVGAIKTGSRPISLVATQHHHRMIGKRQRKCIDVGAVERKPCDDDAMRFQKSHHVINGTAWQIP